MWPVEAAFEPLLWRPAAVSMRFIQMYDIISALFSMDTCIRGIEVRGDIFGSMSAFLNFRYYLGTHPAGTIPIEFVHADTPCGIPRLEKCVRRNSRPSATARRLLRIRAFDRAY